MHVSGGVILQNSTLAFSPKIATKSAWIRTIVGVLACVLSVLRFGYAATTPTLTVATSSTPSTYGSSATFTATISSGPTGTITFYDGSTSIGTGAINSKKATLAISTLSSVGVHSITANYAGNASYNAVTSSATTQTVDKATPTITWPTPTAITYGTVLSAAQLSASSAVAGIYSYAPAAGAVLNAGSQSLSVTLTPTDATDYNTATKTVTLTVNKATPTISVSTSASTVLYGTSATLTATVSAGPTGTVAFYDGSTSLGTATLSGTSAGFTISSLAVGTHSITAKYSGDANYQSVTSSAISETVSQVAPAITWSSPAPITYGVALSSAQLNATANVPGTFSYDPAAAEVLDPGTQSLSVTFTPADSTNYSTATASVSLTVSRVPSAGQVTTVAGNGYWGSAGDGGAAVSATIGRPMGLGVNSAGDIYFSANSSVFSIRGVTASTGIIQTQIGNGEGGYSGDGGPAGQAEVYWPMGMKFDRAGNFYFADNGNAVVRKVSLNGTITTVAGTGQISGYRGDGGSATDAYLSYDTDIAVDSAGNLYIADRYNMRVRKVWTATGIITTVAGTGTAGYSGDGGAATSAQLDWPFGVAVDAVGNIYIADLDNNVIRKVTAATGTISTMAGNGTAGYSGDGGPATNAQLNQPYSVAVDAAGDLYISDSGNSVVRMVRASDGTISTVAGTGTACFSGDGGPATSAGLDSPWSIDLDPAGNLYIADNGNERIRMVGSVVTEPTLSLPAIIWPVPASIVYGTPLGEAQLNATANVSGTFVYTPAAGALLPAGTNALSALFIPSDAADYGAMMTTMAINVLPATPALTWATPSPIPVGTALSPAQLNATANVPGTFSYTPNGGARLAIGQHTLSVTFTPDDSQNYAQVSSSVEITVTPLPASGIITTIAGTGEAGYIGDGGSAIGAELNRPLAVLPDNHGNLYIADTSNFVIRRLEINTGTITTIAGNGANGFSGDGGAAANASISVVPDLALDSAGNLYFSDGNRIRKVSATTGIITTVAGNTTQGYSGDGGLATSAELNNPCGLTLDANGNIYIADSNNNVLRKVDAVTGIITTFAGNGTGAFAGDGGTALSAEFNIPAFLAFDSQGNLYVVDWLNERIRKISTAGIVSTIAGNGQSGYSGDGGPATSAALGLDGGLSFDAHDNLYFVDSDNNRVRMVSATTGAISTVAGTGVQGFSGDGGPAVLAQMNTPEDVAADAAGNLFIPDDHNNRVRVIGTLNAAPVSVTVAPQGTTLHGGQQQQFTATVVNTSNTAVTWSISPSGAGNISATGLYTAPGSVATQQMVTITATSQADSSKSASTPVTLLPAVSVTVTPATAALYAGQQQQFSASVAGATNGTVTWSLSPTGIGTIDATGLFTAPVSIGMRQTVVVMAVSDADATKYASATLTLLPPCGTRGYSYARTVTLNHAMVKNTDQADFPVLISVTDPQLKNVAQGGHVASSQGFDILFSSDSSGYTKLDFEIEQYIPSTGQLVAWVRIPLLSHNVDTPVYLLYGNTGILQSQQNVSGVWQNHYSAVYHLSDTASVEDSSANANSLTNYGATATIGVIGGGLHFTGREYAYSGSPNAMPTGTSARSISAWVQALKDQNGEDEIGWGDNNGNGRRWAMYGNGRIIGVEGENLSATSDIPFDGNWHYITVTSKDGNSEFSQVSIYIDGVNTPISSSSGTFNTVAGRLALGAIPDAPYNGLFKGNLDEARISSVDRSDDWIATEYANQSSPATFSSLAPESAFTISPGAGWLANSQTLQFQVGQDGSCIPSVTWSLSTGALGNISSSGLYTAPSSIATAQKVTVIATDTADSSKTGTAVVNLIAGTPQFTLSPVTQPPYQAATTQGFLAILTNSDGSAAPGIPVTLTISGANASTLSAVTDNYGIAPFNYPGINSGTDSLVASVLYMGGQIQSNVLSVAWNAANSSGSVGSVTLQDSPVINLEALVGAFTDLNGTVIEPVAIGASPHVFVVPYGATQLQLGVDDGYYEDNWGAGFTVTVNGMSVTVPAGGMPWLWTAGGLNSNYEYGILDGAPPTIAATGLTSGQTIVVAYQSGLNSPGGVYGAIYDGDGIPTAPDTPSAVGNATGYAPSHYMSRQSYPTYQPISISGIVKGQAGALAANVPVLLTVAGANSRQLASTSDANGNIAFTYIGQNAGTDLVTATAMPNGSATLSSNQVAVTWVAPTNLPAGSLAITPTAVSPQHIGGSIPFTIYATDSSGSPIGNLPVALNVIGPDGSGRYGTSAMIGTTDSTGHATIVYNNTVAGTDSVEASAIINNLVAISNSVTVPWTLPALTGTTAGGSGTLSISVNATLSVTLPNSLPLNGAVSDTALAAGDTISTTWSQLSGPGTATFSTPNQPVTSVTFDKMGNYVLLLSASDLDASGSLQVPISVYPAPGTTQGWIGSPVNGTAVSGVVPITVASGVTLQSGVLTYYPANNPGAVTVLNGNTTGSGQIGVLDTTTLQNGSYWITLEATDTTGDTQYNLALVNVTGTYKPGRVTATVTDLVVPVKGVSVSIQRTYDSLNATTVGDFGYGWTLGTNVNLVVGAKGDVTFTLGGVRRTFYLTPITGNFVFPFSFASYTAEPGFHGTLSESAPGCPDLLDVLIQDGSLWACPGGTYYNPPGYVYTDPSGTAYTMSAGGTLQSIIDKNGNALTITANGITSSTGISVPFVRDANGRITQITDPQGHVYQYGYDENGNLASVTYPDTPTPSTYSYDANHLYLSGTDFRSNPLPSSEYYSSADTDAAGNPLSGRVKSVTDAAGATTSYAYDLATHTTTITYPADGSGSQGTATMVYNTWGDLLTSTDPLGHTTTNVYDASRNLISVTDPMGRKTSYTYDTNGNKTSTTYPATSSSTNTTSTTAYNQYSEPTSTTDELGNVRSFTYDDYYNPQSVTDTLGTLASFQFNTDGTMQNGAVGYDIATQASKASQFAYDANGNLSSRTDALGRVTSYTYDALGHKLTMTVPVPTGSTAAAATTTYSYDDFGNLTQTAAPQGRTTSSTYDSNGNKLTDTDANGRVTHYTYDALNRLTLTTYPDNTTSSKTYDFRGNVLTETDQAGHVTKHEYDLAGREVSVTRAYGTSDASATSYEYDDAGRKVGETDSLGHSTSYNYDAAGNLTSVSGVGGSITYAYDNARNRISMTDGNGNTTGYKYDARKRLIETDYPDGTKTTNTYDGPGNLIKVVDQANHEVDYSYDAANQLQQVTQASSPNSANTTIVGYDADGNPITLQDVNVHTTATRFDLLGEVTGKTLPDGSLSETRTYDTAGNLLTLKHFNGVTTTYTYDNLNRLLSRSTPGETAVGFTYTATGKYLTSTDASGTTTYTYDNMDRLITKATPAGTLSYTYDAAGHVESISSSNANGASVSYTYDDLNRLSTVVDHRLSGSSTITYTYDTANNVATVTYPNGVQSTFSYDVLNRVTGLSASTGSYTYQRGAVGNLTSATESTGRTIAWNYDGINRLTSETITGGTVSGSVAYGLDPVGNRSSASSSLTGVSSGSWSFNADDELLSESYDTNGNVIASGGKTFAYNSQNQLVSMNGGAVTLVYDAFGNRVAKMVNGVTTRYLIEDDANPTGYPQVFDELTNGVVTRTYTYGLQRISQQQVISNAWTPSFYGYDGGGNVRRLTNAAGAVTDSYEYDAFGNVLNKTGSTPNVCKYRGEQWDSDLGLYYLRARYYNPANGRFSSRDPFSGYFDDPKTLHKYLYVGGDPTNWWDPTGWDLVEFGELDENSEGAAAGEEAAAREINCVFDAAADLLDVVTSPDILSGAVSLTSLAIDAGSCTAKGRRKSIPDTGPPNGISEGPRRTRQYGPDGKPLRDFDKPHGGAQYPHIHEWPGGIREEPGRPYSPWPRGRNPL